MAQQASNPQREPSMDEILASIRRIIEESEPDRSSVDLSAIEELTSGPAIGPAANDATAQAAAPNVDPIAPEIESMELRSGSLDDAYAIDPELDAAFRQMEVARAELDQPVIETAAVETRQPVDLPQAAVPEQDRSKTIISDRASRQVAASFGDLADAFAASRRRSFDEMAEEMLRPMLQDWLDNNLPTLVERLVREEIERVARGG